jgi:hypothetical protein
MKYNEIVFYNSCTLILNISLRAQNMLLIKRSERSMSNSVWILTLQHVRMHVREDGQLELWMLKYRI